MLKMSANEKSKAYQDYYEMLSPFIYRKDYINRGCPAYQHRAKRIMHKLDKCLQQKNYTPEQYQIIHGRFMRFQNFIKYGERRIA